ncbi:MAG: N-formylglutamate amidohydrolase [Hydrogenophilales bacterium]|nr:N-formylglutamate amidohydrolase [Hydrogenophilales bacterium]
MPRTEHVLITCEHGGNRIPPCYRLLFAGFETLLHSHRGYDPGALAVARKFARLLDAPLFVSTTSRLLIDLNRSIGHPKLYSEATRNAPAAVRREILARHYLPYRTAVEAHIAAAIARGSRVIHLASHSFTPVLDGVVRNADVGLLYDPARAGEAELCRRWQLRIESRARGLRLRRNYPYTGKSDGFTAFLRRRFSADLYVGIELEINQKHVLPGGRRWLALQALVVETFHSATMECQGAGMPAPHEIRSPLK